MRRAATRYFNLLHLGSQSVCLRAGLNGSPASPATPLAVDFIVRTENMDDDLPPLLAEINRRRDPSLPPFPYNGTKTVNERKTNFIKELFEERLLDMPYTQEAAYSGPYAGCLQQVANHYRSDFDLLGFPCPPAFDSQSQQKWQHFKGCKMRLQGPGVDTRDAACLVEGPSALKLLADSVGQAEVAG